MSKARTSARQLESVTIRPPLRRCRCFAWWLCQSKALAEIKFLEKNSADPAALSVAAFQKDSAYLVFARFFNAAPTHSLTPNSLLHFFMYPIFKQYYQRWLQPRIGNGEQEADPRLENLDGTLHLEERLSRWLHKQSAQLAARAALHPASRAAERARCDTFRREMLKS